MSNITKNSTKQVAINETQKLINTFNVLQNKSITFASKELENKTNLLKEVINDGGRYAGAEIIANTSVTLQPKKNGCPYGVKDDVKSITEYSVCVNGRYADSINKRREKENKATNFVAKPNWFVRLYDGKNGSIVAKRKEVENNLPITETYIFFTNKPLYKGVPSYNYSLQGRDATNEEILTIKKFKKDRKIEASKSQGLSVENALIVNTVKVSNIHEIRANKQVLNF
jgi:hypothetical protein